jgi:redox-regulated HSP33 family molecular chaperone
MGEEMSEIRFYIPQNESIPTDLRLYVGENYVEYKRTANGFLFKTFIDDEDDAMQVVQQIVNKMKSEHDESSHGISWRTISLAVVPKDERYKIGTWVEWKYRVRDSY